MDNDVYLELLYKMRSSVMTIVIYTGHTDMKICLEVGAAVLLNKPVILVITNHAPIPPQLRSIASVIIEGNPKEPETKEQIQKAINKMMEIIQNVDSTPN